MDEISPLMRHALAEKAYSEHVKGQAHQVERLLKRGCEPRFVRNQAYREYTGKPHASVRR